MFALGIGDSVMTRTCAFVLIFVAILSQPAVARTIKTRDPANTAKLNVNGTPCTPVMPNHSGSTLGNIVALPQGSLTPKLVTRAPDTETVGNNLKTGVPDTPGVEEIPDVSGDNNDDNARDLLQDQLGKQNDAAGNAGSRPTTSGAGNGNHNGNGNAKQTTSPPSADGSGCKRTG